MSRKIKVHFVCLGNAYRSRLAEAYAKSLQLRGFEFSSSGIAAHLFEQRNPHYTDLIAKNHQMLRFLSPGQRQTTSKILAEQDVIVFMEDSVLREAQKMFTFNYFKVHCWDIEDLWEACLRLKVREDDYEKTSEIAERTFQRIKHHVDYLAREMTKSGWVDVVDENNSELDYRQPINTANKKSLWYRGVRVLVRTHDGRYVVEKRANKIFFAPGLLDISLGGYVDVGETPVRAAAREIKEELGVEIKPHQLKLLRIVRGSTYHPKYHMHTKCFSYTYFVELQPGQENMKPQQSEVAQILLATHDQVKKLIRRHHLKHFGRLNYIYKTYKENLKLAEEVAD